MVTYIALLRAINLAAINRVAMSDLRDMLTALDLREPRTLLQSGNVVFRSAVGSTRKLEAQLDAACAKRLKVATECFVRSSDEWKAILAGNPFPHEAKADPARLIVVFLKNATDRSAADALQKAIKGREVVRANGREAYISYPDGQGRSKLTIAMIEKHFGTRGTARNWNTVLKLGAMAGESE
jgi:uncharacterized protein (DUF1697 family)